MKRRLAILLACLLIPGLTLTACERAGLPRLGPQKPRTVTLWTYYNGEQKKAFDALVDDFNATEGLEMGIVVQPHAMAGIDALNEAIQASAQKEPGSALLPNMLFAYGDTAYDLAQQGLIQDFDRYLSPGEMDTFVPDFLEEGKILDDGKLYILPAAKSTEVLVLNKTALDTFFQSIVGDSRYRQVGYGHFATWEGIEQAAQVYYRWTEDELGYGKAFFGLDSVANFVISSFRQLGDEVTAVKNGQGVVALRSPAMRRVWDMYYGNRVKGTFAAYGRYRSDDLKTGDVVAFLGSSASGAYLPTEVIGEDGLPHPAEMMVLPMPVFEGGTPCAIQQGAGLVLMKAEAEQEYASAMFARWFTQAQRNRDFAVASSYMPVRKEAAAALSAQEKVAALPAVRVSIDQVNTYDMYTPKPFVGAYTARTVLESLKNEVDNAKEQIEADIKDGIPPRTALQNALSPQRLEAFILRNEAKLSAAGLAIR